MDYLGVKRFDAAGRVIGERRFLGLYTSSAYNTNPARDPAAAAQGRGGRRSAPASCRSSHAAKALVTILEQYPRDELFQIGDDELYATAMGILRLGERQRTRLFVRRDVFGRFCSCLIYVPRENYNTDLRARMQALLIEVFQRHVVGVLGAVLRLAAGARADRRAHARRARRRRSTCARSSSGWCASRGAGKTS